jgi:hypothetical protein
LTDAVRFGFDKEVIAARERKRTHRREGSVGRGKVAEAHKRKDGTGVFFIARHELALQPGIMAQIAIQATT